MPSPNKIYEYDTNYGIIAVKPVNRKRRLSRLDSMKKDLDDGNVFPSSGKLQRFFDNYLEKPNGSDMTKQDINDMKPGAILQILLCMQKATEEYQDEGGHLIR